MNFYPGTRVSKYRAVRTEVDGIKFASKKEAQRYQQLRLLERAGKISGLLLQTKFRLIVQDVLVCSYVCDFQYLEDGRVVIEDSKGFKTPEYKIKKKLMKALYGIEIRET